MQAALAAMLLLLQHHFTVQQLRVGMQNDSSARSGIAERAVLMIIGFSQQFGSTSLFHPTPCLLRPSSVSPPKASVEVVLGEPNYQRGWMKSFQGLHPAYAACIQHPYSNGEK